MSVSEIFAQLDFLDWRDARMEEISVQLTAAFPGLLSRIDARLDGARVIDLLRSDLKLRHLIGGEIGQWAEEQAREALAEAEASMGDLRETLQRDLSLDASANDRLQAALPALASAGLAAASIAAVPTVLSFATVTTSTLAFFGVSYISWPLFAVGAAAIGGIAWASRSFLDRSIDRWRSSLRRRAHERARALTFGDRFKNRPRTVLDDIQTLVIRTSANSLGSSV